LAEKLRVSSFLFGGRTWRGAQDFGDPGAQRCQIAAAQRAELEEVRQLDPNRFVAVLAAGVQRQV
jgi:hypothetical protein